MALRTLKAMWGSGGRRMPGVGAWHSVQNEGGGKVVCTAYTFYRSIDVQISNTRLSYVLPKHII